MATPILDMRGVTVRRAGRPILDGLDWRIMPGERWVVLGPNGAGKTTAVSVLSGRLFPTAGRVDILGMRLGRVDVRTEIWPRVALASACLDMRFPPGQCVADIVKTGKFGHLAKFREECGPEDDARAARVLAELGIAHLAFRSLRGVSTGERKRIAIARALMGTPEILVLDEPASGLDLGGRERFLAALADLVAACAPAPILVTHHVEEIPPGFTHALLVRDGRAYAAGPLEETLSSPVLSGLFGLDLDVRREAGRYRAIASGERDRPRARGRAGNM